MPNDLFLLMARLLMAGLFIPSGLHTLGDIDGAAAYFAGLGVPFATATGWSVGLFELGAGLLILVGLLTRPASLLLAVFCIAAGFIGHFGQGGADPALAFMHQQMLMKDIALAGGLLALACAGAGKFSIDFRRFAAI